MDGSVVPSQLELSIGGIDFLTPLPVSGWFRLSIARAALATLRLIGELRTQIAAGRHIDRWIASEEIGGLEADLVNLDRPKKD